jgi:hypothetical protein
MIDVEERKKDNKVELAFVFVLYIIRYLDSQLDDIVVYVL